MGPVVNTNSLLTRFFPFISWLPDLKRSETLRADIIAGITVALVLIPQSMAYAQLAGLPPYFGLYAAFMPPMVAALFGSSRQLATGPVAVVSLMTAAALEPIAASGSAGYAAYAILLAIMVGIFQVFLGVFRLGVLVNFLSHPVILGFTNAAALIIATSQLGKIFGVSVEKADKHAETVWRTLMAAIENTHWPTLIMAILAFSLMIGVRHFNPKLPNVLIAVVITSLLSWSLGFHEERQAMVETIEMDSLQSLIQEQNQLQIEISDLSLQISQAQSSKRENGHGGKIDSPEQLVNQHHIEDLQFQRKILSDKKVVAFRLITNTPMALVDNRFIPEYALKEGTATTSTGWKIKNIDDPKQLTLKRGGAIVGTIPAGLPSMKLPTFDWDVFIHLITVAITVSLIGFMEAISIAKAMAAKTRQRLDANRELVGQGLSNIVGSMFQSYAVSGSFSRSAVNIGAGAATGFSSVVTSIVVIITLLWLTPLLYFLPQATLAAVIMLAVIGLINIKGVMHTWKVKFHDGAASVITFILTLVFAPHLDKGIMIGVGLSLLLYLYRSMKPRVVCLSRYEDGTMRDVNTYNLEMCDEIKVMRFEGSLYFANTSYFNETVQEILAQSPNIKFLIVEGVSINQLDATGEHMLAELVEQLEDTGISVLFSRFKKPVMELMRKSGFVEEIGKEHFFRRPNAALEYAWETLGEDHMKTCPLRMPNS